MEDSYFEDINELNEAIDSGVRDSDQVHRAIGVASELDNTYDTVASLERYDSQTDTIIRNSVAALMKVASIGVAEKTIADMQSFSQDLDLKTATLESIGATASKIWEKIINAIKSALQWVKKIFGKLFGTQSKTSARHDSLEKKIKQISANSSSKSIRFTYTPALSYFVDTKMKLHSQQGHAKASSDIALLEKKSKEWLDNKGDSKFFQERIGISGSDTVNFAYGSGNLASAQILVQSQGEMPKTSDQKVLFAWLQSVKCGYTEHRDVRNPNIGKEFTVDVRSVNWEAILDALKKYSKLIEDATVEMEKIHSAAESLVKQAERTLDREGRGSDSKKAMDAKMELLRASFLVNGPLSRYVMIGTKISATASSQLDASLTAAV